MYYVQHKTDHNTRRTITVAGIQHEDLSLSLGIATCRPSDPFFPDLGRDMAIGRCEKKPLTTVTTLNKKLTDEEFNHLVDGICIAEFKKQLNRHKDAVRMFPVELVDHEE